MRTSRSILYTALGTGLCLLYVFQQTEIVKLGYRITVAEKALESCLDKRTDLQYQVASLESPVSLDKNFLLMNNGFELAKDYKLVMLTPQAPSGPKAAEAIRPKRGLSRLAFQNLFAGKQAEAKPAP